MTISDTFLHPTYKELGDLNAEHGVYLVQNRLTKKVFVKKTLTRYNYDVLLYLQKHPVANMPQIFELVEDNGTLIVIEEYITGSTLQEMLDEQGPFTEEQTADYALQLCQILSQLHGASPAIIHRDIKPSNIILSPDGVLKLIDENAAKQYHYEKKRDTTLLGTTGYAAPEQYGIGASGVQADIYSVGALMNVLLCAELPAVRIADGKLSQVIKKCLETSPCDRYQSADKLANAIHAAVYPNAAQKYDTTWRRFLPPGFRSLNIFHMLLSALGYSFVLWLGLNMEIVGTINMADLWMNRILITLMFLAIVFFSGNYLNVQQHFPLSRSENPVIRVIGVMIADGILFVLCLTAISIIDLFLFR